MGGGGGTGGGRGSRGQEVVNEEEEGKTTWNNITLQQDFTVMHRSSPTALCTNECTHLFLKVCTRELKCIAESLSTGQTDAQTVWSGERRVTGL